MNSDSGVAATELTPGRREVYLVSVAGADLEGQVSFEDGLWWGRVQPIAPPLYWGDDFDTSLEAFTAVERYIKENSL